MNFLKGIHGWLLQFVNCPSLFRSETNSLTRYLDWVVSKSVNQLAHNFSVIWVWVWELHRQCNGAERFSADQLAVGIFELSSALVHPAQSDSSPCHRLATVVRCVQEAVQGHITARLHVSIAGGGRDCRTNEQHCNFLPSYLSLAGNRFFFPSPNEFE